MYFNTWSARCAASYMTQMLAVLVSEKDVIQYQLYIESFPFQVLAPPASASCMMLWQLRQVV